MDVVHNSFLDFGTSFVMTSLRRSDLPVDPFDDQWRWVQIRTDTDTLLDVVDEGVHAGGGLGQIPIRAYTKARMVPAVFVEGC